MLNALITLATLLWIAAAHAAPAVVFTQIDDGPVQATHAEARQGQTVTLYAAVRHKGQWYADAPSLRVKRRQIVPRPLSDLGVTGVEWRLIEPRQHHQQTPPPNPGNPAYSNSVLFGPKHGRWLGYDTLEYTAIPLPQAQSQLQIKRATPSDRHLLRNKGLGTVRYAVTLRAATQAWQSPGVEAQGQGGIRETVRRVSYRSGDDAVGWLTSFYNVPNVFGSAGKGRAHQTERHQGADCADVLTGAFRKAGVRVPYTSVSGLYRHAKVITPKLISNSDGLFTYQDGEPGEPVRLRFGVDVKPGDLVVIDYAFLLVTKRSWDHVGMIGADRGEIGVWDRADGLLHMGYLYGLEHTPLSAQGPAVIQVLRLKPSLTRRARRLDPG